MRMLVLGAGLQGSACAYDLLRQPGVERVTIADLKPERIPGFLKPHVGKRLALLKLDVQDAAALRAAVRGHDAVLNAAPYYFNLDVMRAADWIIDLGPEGGEEGGRIVAEGRPEQIAHTPGSHTGRFLRPLLSLGL